MYKFYVQCKLHKAKIGILSCLAVGLWTHMSAQSPVFTMPFDAGVTTVCTQGPGGVFSHTSSFTANDYDFAEPEDTLVLAAADGIAHVFHDVVDPKFIAPKKCSQATSKSFGNYVAIDHGNGLFTIYAHLKTIIAGIDGQRVFRYAPIGTVDSTGFSCGNHLHFGLHQGDSTQSALSSKSIPITNFFTQAINDAQPQLFSGSAAPKIECGFGAPKSEYKAVRLPPAPNAFLFIANEDSSTIAAFEINGVDGSLIAVPGSPFATGHTPVSLTATTSAKFLFAGTEAQAGPLVSYSVNPQDGSLKMVGSFPVGETTFPLFLSLHPNNKFIFLTWQGLGPSFMLGSSFDLTSGVLPGNFIGGGRGGNSVIVDPLGRFVFSAGTDAFVTGQFIFSRPFDPTVGMFSGAQTQLPADSVPTALAVDPAGKFLYVANRGLTGVSGYLINSVDGSLKPIAHSPFPSGSDGRCLVTDKTGRFLYVSTEPNDIWAYTVDQLDGTLTFLNDFRFIGDAPGAGCLTVDPSGVFLYATNPQSGSVSAFKINSDTGELLPLLVFRVPTGGLTPLSITSTIKP